MRLVAAVLYYLAGVLWLVQFLGDGSIIKLAMGVIWLSGGVFQTVRYIRSKKPPKEERSNG